MMATAMLVIGPAVIGVGLIVLLFGIFRKSDRNKDIEKMNRIRAGKA